MEEKFLGIKKTIGERVDKFFKDVLDRAPSYEVAAAGLVHGKSCSQTKPLRKVEFNNAFNSHDGGVWGINTRTILVSQKYVECGECGVSARYSE